MPDPDLLTAIVADPNDETRWLNLARWFADNGRDDDAAAVRVFWPALLTEGGERSTQRRARACGESLCCSSRLRPDNKRAFT
jgi:uncharacterized protein (TIGR02996 family)